MNLLEFREKLNDTIDCVCAEKYDPTEVEVHVLMSLPDSDVFSSNLKFHFDGDSMVSGCVIEGLDAEHERYG